MKVALAAVVAAALLGAGCAQVADRLSSVLKATGGPAPTVVPGPVLATNFPDPFLLRTAQGFYAYATNSAGVNVQVAYSPDMRAWNLERSAPDGSQLDALPQLPPWVRPPQPDRSADVWAPEVMKIGAKFVLYFSARHRSAMRRNGENRLCIGAAVSDKPDRDFKPQAQPIICEPAAEGVIDASPFRDRGKLYLYYKSDGNCCGLRTGIFAQQLASDGLRVTGPPIGTGKVNDAPWEGASVEAPTMFRHAGRYFLFYSGSYYGGPAYAVGYAICKTPFGPCKDGAENPILSSSPAGARPALLGPGHQSVLDVAGRTFIAYHAWQTRPDGTRGDARLLYINELTWPGGVPQVQKSGPATPVYVRDRG